jgi:hypothetical protein
MLDEKSEDILNIETEETENSFAQQEVLVENSRAGEELSDGTRSAKNFMKRLSIAGINILMVLTLAVLGLIAWFRLPSFIQNLNKQSAAQAESADMVVLPVDSQPAVQNDVAANLELSSFPFQVSNQKTGILRKPLLFTVIPTRPRVDVITCRPV